jgi:hypothetical protein
MIRRAQSSPMRTSLPVTSMKVVVDMGTISKVCNFRVAIFDSVSACARRSELSVIEFALSMNTMVTARNNIAARRCSSSFLVCPTVNASGWDPKAISDIARARSPLPRPDQHGGRAGQRRPADGGHQCNKKDALVEPRWDGEVDEGLTVFAPHSSVGKRKSFEHFTQLLKCRLGVQAGRRCRNFFN